MKTWTCLEATAEAEDEVKGRLLLDVVVSKGTTILELLTSENETLLVRGDALLVLDLLLHGLDGVGRVDIEGDGLASEGLDEDLHTSTTTEAEDKVKGGLLLDVVVSKGAAILELLTSENETLLVRGNALLVLDLLLHGLDGVGRVDIKGDGLAGESLDKDLHRHGEEIYLLRIDKDGW